MNTLKESPQFQVLDSHLACLRTVTTDFPNDFVHHPLAFSLLLMLERMHASQREERCTSADAARPLSTPSPTLPLIVTPSTKTTLEKEATLPPIPLIKIEDEDVIVLDDDKEKATKVEAAKRDGAVEGRSIVARPASIPTPIPCQSSSQLAVTPHQRSFMPPVEKRVPRPPVPFLIKLEDELISVEEEINTIAMEEEEEEEETASTAPGTSAPNGVGEKSVQTNVAMHLALPPPPLSTPTQEHPPIKQQPDSPIPSVKMEHPFDYWSVVAVEGELDRSEEVEDEEEKNVAEDGPNAYEGPVVRENATDWDNAPMEEEYRDVEEDIPTASTSTGTTSLSGGVRRSESVEPREVDHPNGEATSAVQQHIRPSQKRAAPSIPRRGKGRGPSKPKKAKTSAKPQTTKPPPADIPQHVKDAATAFMQGARQGTIPEGFEPYAGHFEDPQRRYTWKQSEQVDLNGRFLEKVGLPGDKLSELRISMDRVGKLLGKELGTGAPADKVLPLLRLPTDMRELVVKAMERENGPPLKATLATSIVRVYKRSPEVLRSALTSFISNDEMTVEELKTAMEDGKGVAFTALRDMGLSPRVATLVADTIKEDLLLKDHAQLDTIIRKSYANTYSRVLAGRMSGMAEEEVEDRVAEKLFQRFRVRAVRDAFYDGLSVEAQAFLEEAGVSADEDDDDDEDDNPDHEDDE